MNPERYEFACQKALYDSFRLAKSLGHHEAEVEHVVSCLIRNEPLLRSSVHELIRKGLQNYLYDSNKVFGTHSIAYGARLRRVFVKLEKKQSKTISKAVFLQGLCLESPWIQQVLRKNINEEILKEETSRIDKVQAWKPQQFNSNSQPHSKNDSPSEQSSGEAEVVVAKETNKLLRKYTLDLTELAEMNEPDPIIGRDVEVRRVMEVLGRKKKNNPLLVGDPGVGKTAVAELLAMLIVKKRVPEHLIGVRVLALDVAALMGGTKYRGECEQRLKEILNCLQDIGRQVVLFIDEIHMIIGLGNAEGGADAANLLKPFLARGGLQCLGATTVREYRNSIEKDGALNRRFQPVWVTEPDEEACIAILRGLKPKYEVFHGVNVNDSALIAAVRLGNRYISDRNQPDKSIDILDEACSRMRMQVNSKPSQMEMTESAIERLEIEKSSIEQSAVNSAAIAKLEVKINVAQSQLRKQDAIWQQARRLYNQLGAYEQEEESLKLLFENSCSQGDYGFAAKLEKKEQPELKNRLDSLRAQISVLQREYPYLSRVVGENEVAAVVACWSGIPVFRLANEQDRVRLQSAGERLSQRIFGQDEAVAKLYRALKRTKMGVNDPGRPLGVFLFLGESGVGKTETAKALSQEIFTTSGKMLRLDMSEYMEAHSVARLIGSPPGYVGHYEGGVLTEAVKRDPYTLVLLDELEKAHPRVFDILLQLFEDGRLTDSRGETIDFRHSLFIMTSNIRFPHETQESHLRTYLRSYFRAELVGRIDEIIIFKQLELKHLRQLLDTYIESLNARLSEREIRVSLGSEVMEYLLDFPEVQEFGARSLRRLFQEKVIDFVADWLLENIEDRVRGAWLIKLHEGVFSIVADNREHLFLNSG